LCCKEVLMMNAKVMLLSKCMAFQSFDLERPLLMLFLKHVVRTKLDIYFFI
jgi:hypothetical protein